MNWLITDRNKNLYWAFGLVAGSWSIFLSISAVIWLISNNSIKPAADPQIKVKLLRSGSDTAFREYVKSNEFILNEKIVPQELPQSTDLTLEKGSFQINQAEGIEKPDQFKYLNNVIYLSDPTLGSINRYEVNADNSIKQTESVSEYGDLMLNQSVLIALSKSKINAYDIDSKDKLNHKWQMNIEDNQQLAAARIVDNLLLVFTSTPVSANSPCPIPLLKDGDTIRFVECSDVWHPNDQIDSGILITLIKIDASSGRVIDRFSYLTDEDGFVYIAKNEVYTGTTLTKHPLFLTADFLTSPNSNLISEDKKNKLIKTLSLELSSRAKLAEIDSIISQNNLEMNDSDRIKWEANLNDMLGEYVDTNLRDLSKTIITRIDLMSFKPEISITVSGHVLDQFSINEYNNYLRIATTSIGAAYGGKRIINDVYVLNKNLDFAGQLWDVGTGERISNIEFIGDKGFVTGYEEDKPIQILDFSQPENPKVSGMLPFTGYLGHFYELSSNALVGVSQEEDKVKVQLFDILNPDNPVVVGSYLLEESWSNLFPNNQKLEFNQSNEVFYLPSKSGGYIFSYKGSELTLSKSIKNPFVTFSKFLNNNLFLMSTYGINVLNAYDNWNQ